MNRIALVAGASGLVGRHLVHALLDSPDYASVLTLTRRTLPIPHPKLVQGIVDFDALPEFALAQPVDDAFSCLGTTIRDAGSERAFRHVDFGLTLAVARKALAAGATQFVFVSAMGADPGSRVFYNRIKGEIEDAVAALPFHATIALRPSLLLGERSRPRLGEGIAASLARPLRPLMPPAWRPIGADAVARAMVVLAQMGLAGRIAVSSDRIAALARGEDVALQPAPPAPSTDGG